MGLIIKAVRDGFRRAGIAHAKSGTFYADDHFSEEELEILRAEPQLIVIEGIEEPEQGGGDENEGTELEGNGAQTGTTPGASKPKAAGTQAGRVRAGK